MPDAIWHWMSAATFLMWFAVGCAFLFGNADRSVPLRVVAFEANTPAPGELLQVRMEVVEDLTRTCSRSSSRWVVDSSGFVFGLAFDAVGAAHQGATRRRLYDLQRAVDLPASIASGSARYFIRSEFVCNPMQRYWPIESYVEIPFHVRSAQR